MADEWIGKRTDSLIRTIIMYIVSTGALTRYAFVSIYKTFGLTLCSSVAIASAITVRPHPLLPFLPPHPGTNLMLLSLLTTMNYSTQRCRATSYSSRSPPRFPNVCLPISLLSSSGPSDEKVTMGDSAHQLGPRAPELPRGHARTHLRADLDSRVELGRRFRSRLEGELASRHEGERGAG